MKTGPERTETAMPEVKTAGSCPMCCGPVDGDGMTIAAVSTAGSLTLDNKSVQRLFDYGVLHYVDGRWTVCREVDL